MKEKLAKLPEVINERPLDIFAAAGGARDLSLGLGYLFNVQHISNTLLWKHCDELWPGVSAYVVGVLFVICGVLALTTSIFGWEKIIRIVLRTQALLWLFAMLMYLLYGEWSLAIYLAGYMMFISGYLAYCYKFAIMKHRQEVLTTKECHARLDE